MLVTSRSNWGGGAKSLSRDKRGVCVCLFFNNRRNTKTKVRTIGGLCSNPNRGCEEGSREMVGTDGHGGILKTEEEDF